MTEHDESTLLETIRTQRVEKIQQLRTLGIEPYPAGPIEKTSAAEAAKLPDDTTVTIAGRIMLFRVMGNIAFGQLHDESGQIQFMLSKRELEQTAPEGQGFKFWVKQLDLGDFIAVEGVRMETKTGERSVSARQITMLSKALRPLPDKHAGLSNEDIRLRKRYLDVLLNRDVQEMIYRKARFWSSIRRHLENRGFVEVQTPALEFTTGGADARPFVTHHNFLDVDVNLRISMGELWQKRLLVGGLEKVFEIGRQFRNESQSREHLNDYDQVEFYWAYANYDWGMQLVQELLVQLVQEVWGTLQFTLHRNGREYDVDLGGEWQRYDYVDTVKQITGVDVLSASLQEMVDRLEELEVSYEKDGLNRARAMDSLWKHCRRQLAGPGFLVNEPLEVSPLAKRSPAKEGIVERFHVLIAGSELGNGYSELNDPVDQAERFAEQQALRDAGDSEAQMADHEFVEALEYGMPPACGFGMSERVFAFFEDKSIRECQIFPLLKPMSS
ncbi:lysine--tRNA ligase [Flindersiella endophytica]